MHASASPVIAPLGPQPAPDELAPVRDILREYADGLGIDLAFQAFDRELAELPGDYAPPRGVLLLVRVDGQLAGCDRWMRPTIPTPRR